VNFTLNHLKTPFLSSPFIPVCPRLGGLPFLTRAQTLHPSKLRCGCLSTASCVVIDKSILDSSSSHIFCDCSKPLNGVTDGRHYFPTLIISKRSARFVPFWPRPRRHSPSFFTISKKDTVACYTLFFLRFE